MLAYPVSTTRKEKLEMIHTIKERLLVAHGDAILAIGAYGSIALKTDGPFSDIELHVITKVANQLESFEFIYDKFKIELSTKDHRTFIKQAKEVDDSWAIKAGVFIHILPIHDPTHLFEQVKDLPFEALDANRRDIMKEFMVWEPYETIAKIRNNYSSGNLNYLDIGARDLLWQSAKLIGLANKTFYTARARTFKESVELASIPSGYKKLLNFITEGQLQDKEKFYFLCEDLWTGLNEWYINMGLDYRLKELPI
ncbi:kanamycin nucleotidyltransferase C-terminal domain-containing protein [Planococcus sp. S3-L1]|uniref:kanamycin nucleotidyltransferase C-terminal domain-containing protein n=1 Tax=Planococcus sp. S3-L1 TaxID=3046200 RepID=UPI0024B8C25A|nr:kanamycin nucleotidyltransferase C-terminal domain-containing protein [Planococcus sp. S3-L1]MDJ0333034.1 kanamycin nucleotidyltransferase C-terminal domain-containing protein [Planococcus sp. S3-L1]